jgi:3-oxoacyl-[acyl-carrier protein] reductase
MGLNLRLRGKVAVVTGGASGFGEGMARAFAREGARVLVADVDVDHGEHVVGEINGPNPEHAVFLETDVTRDADCRRMVDTAMQRFGHIDILVNNAAVTHWNKPMLEVTEEEFDRVFDVNVKAVYLTARHAVPALASRGRGAIINMGSTAALRPRPGLTWYNASKGAVVSLTRSMAIELAPQKIRVNAISPVLGQTRLIEHFIGGADTPERREKFLATIPLGRFSRPEDVANAALYLASDEAEFVTGISIEVDGGRSI